MRYFAALSIISLAATLLLFPERPEPRSPEAVPPPEAGLASADSADREFAAALRRFTSAPLEERKAARRALQRAGYAEVMAGLVRMDGASALGALLRMNAQVRFHLSHRPLYVYIPVTPSRADSLLPPSLFSYKSSPMGVQLSDDWSMPEDPWK
jgi:hypothetical protein